MYIEKANVKYSTKFFSTVPVPMKDCYDSYPKIQQARQTTIWLWKKFIIWKFPKLHTRKENKLHETKYKSVGVLPIMIAI